MMVIYHLVYDLALFGYYDGNVFAGPWRVFARVTASLFILLVGISLTLSYARLKVDSRGWDQYNKYLVRGLKIIGWGMVITLVTWLYMGKPVVIFGILHLIGTTIVLAYPFLSLRWPNLGIGAVLIVLGVYLNNLPVKHPWLLLLGLRPRTLFQVDYFPLLPWLGVALLGIFSGQILYPRGVRKFEPPSRAQQLSTAKLVWLGQRSLIIYLVHQPILISILTVARVISSTIERSRIT